MDPINDQAISGLVTAMTSLLPPVDDPVLTPGVVVKSLRIRPSGLGGFVGLSHEPEGEILGRRLEASALIAVKSNTVAGLNDVVSKVTHALTAAERGTLRQQGILHIALMNVGPMPAKVTAGVAEREVEFGVLYEFIKRPEEAEGIVESIPIDVKLADPPV